MSSVIWMSLASAQHPKSPLEKQAPQNSHNATQTNINAGTLTSGKPQRAVTAPECNPNSGSHTENDGSRQQHENICFAECL
eukprot:1321555-Pyramimonas_sp.AAC.1